jgi:hypothetical protein
MFSLLLPSVYLAKQSWPFGSLAVFGLRSQPISLSVGIRRDLRKKGKHRGVSAIRQRDIAIFL